MIHALSQVWRCYREQGADEVVCRSLHRLRLVSIQHTFEIFFRELQSPEPGAAPPSAGRIVPSGPHRTCREIICEEAETLTYAEGLRYAGDRPILEDLRAHFSRGLRLFAAIEQGTVIALLGVHTRYVHFAYLNRPLVGLPRGVVYLNAALTVPTSRERGIGSALLTCTLDQMREEGYQAACSAVFLKNRGGARWHRINGFEPWGRITWLRWHDKDLWWTRLTGVGRRHPELLGAVPAAGAAS